MWLGTSRERQWERDLFTIAQNCEVNCLPNRCIEYEEGVEVVKTVDGGSVDGCDEVTIEARDWIGRN